MNITTIDPSLFSTGTDAQRRWTRRGLTTSRTMGRAAVVAAVLALPVGGATIAAADAASVGTSKAAIEHAESVSGTSSQTGAHAAHQQAYLDSLQREAAAAAAAPEGRSAFAAQQRDYTAHLAQAASGPDAVAGPGSSSGTDSGDGVPVAVAALLAFAGIAVGTGATVVARRMTFPAKWQTA